MLASLLRAREQARSFNKEGLAADDFHHSGAAREGDVLLVTQGFDQQALQRWQGLVAGLVQ